MKLNYKRTIFVGFAFFLITAFWQAYDTIIPKILTDKFGMSQTWSGVIMALDNVLALFLLPLFGTLSDKTKSKRGRRTPFIVIGTLLACAALLFLGFADAAQTSQVGRLSPQNYESSLVEIWEHDPVISDPEVKVIDQFASLFKGEKKGRKLSEITAENGVDFLKIEMFVKDSEGKDTSKLTDDYTNYVVPARQAYAKDVTAKNRAPLVFFILALLAVLISMGIFRSPAVALMPDVTPKPLRSKGNAIINLMGTVGGAVVLGIGMIIGTGNNKNVLMPFFLYFLSIIALMLLALIGFVILVREVKWAKEAEAQNRLIDELNEEKDGNARKEKAEAGKDGGKKLSKPEMRSLLLILFSVVFWYMGYNAVTSKYSVYAQNVLGTDYQLPLMIALITAAIAFIPVGLLSSKLGRKKTILGGVGMLAASFLAAAFLNNHTPNIVIILCFVFAGIGWASINVNSFPMVVELATGSNTGKYTGYYYTASMAAQTVTPILSGMLLDIHMRTLFPYAVFFVMCSFVTMLFVKHGDSKPLPKDAVLEAAAGGDDD